MIRSTIDVNIGDLLIAPANMRDSRFAKTVLLVTTNHLHGTTALCLNKPTGYQVKDILQSIDLEPGFEFNVPLYWGGPINPSSVWMLHDTSWENPYTMSINDNWCMTSHLSMFEQLNGGDLPNLFRIMVGFAGWAPNQLEKELEGEPPWSKEHSWLVAHNPEPEWLMDQDEESLWETSISLSANQAVNTWL